MAGQSPLGLPRLDWPPRDLGEIQGLLYLTPSGRISRGVQGGSRDGGGGAGGTSGFLRTGNRDWDINETLA